MGSKWWGAEMSNIIKGWSLMAHSLLVGLITHLHFFHALVTSLPHIVIVFITPLTTCKRAGFITPILQVRKVRPLTG